MKSVSVFNIPSQLRLLLAASLFACSVGLSAQEGAASDLKYYAELGGGVEYDSIVVVDELDVSNNEGDYGLLLDAELGLSKAFSNNVDAKLWYDYSRIDYDDASDVSRQTHLAGSTLTADAGKFDLGVTGLYIDSSLDGEGFLSVYRISPFINGFFTKQWFARLAYSYSGKTLDNSAERDASTQSADIDLYYFRDDPGSYLNLAYRFKDEDAESSVFDYHSHGLKLRYVHKLMLFSRQTRLELSWRFEDRDYAGITPVIGERRDDQRHRWRVEYEMPLFARAELQLFYMYSDYESNLPAADYQQNLVGTRISYRWE